MDKKEVPENLGLKERGFEYSGVRAFKQTYIDPNDFGGVIVIEANGQTITLPDMNTVEAGKIITVYCYGGVGQPVTIKAANGNTLSNGSSENNSTQILLTHQESITIVSETGASKVWEVYGIGTFKYSPLFASSLNEYGWTKLPSGIIIQWGYGSCANAGSVEAGILNNFTIPFPQKCLKMVMSHIGFSPQGAGILSFQIVNNKQYRGYSSVAATEKGAVTGSWIAIGY